jgi:hypothetical protein
MEILHETPFVTALDAVVDRYGREARVAVVKATFEIGTQGALAIAPEQLPMSDADVHFGDPATTSVRVASDGAHYKPASDIAVVGSAWSPGLKPSASFSAGLKVGGLRKVVAVFGDRTWRGVGGSVSPPEPVVEVPLRWERAFGGRWDDAAPQRSGWEERNPIGKGFAGARPISAIAGLELPNFEDPDALIRAPTDCPLPQGFGFVERGWMPRRSFAGTYDESWRLRRMPLPPEDFDYRFNNAAAPGLVYAGHLRGDEDVVAVNLSRHGRETFRLPGLGIRFKGRAKGAPFAVDGTLDTATFFFDDRRVALVWRAGYLVGRDEKADQLVAYVTRI